MKLVSISPRGWTFGLAAALVCAGMAWSHRAAAVGPVTAASDFASLGLTASQTLRVSLTNLQPVTPVTTKVIVLPRAVQVTFYAVDGSVLQQSTVTVTLNQTATVDLNGATAAASSRAQVRAEVRLLATPVEAQQTVVPLAFGQIAASEELFDTATGQTTVVIPSPQTIVPAISTATAAAVPSNRGMAICLTRG